MSSILSWNAFWVAVGIFLDLVALAFVFRLGHTAGECDRTDEIHNLTTLLRKQKREIDFLHAENDSLKRIGVNKTQRAYWQERLNRHLEGKLPMTATEAKTLIEAGLLSAYPVGVIASDQQAQARRETGALRALLDSNPVKKDSL
jgi:hypothetical protein